MRRSLVGALASVTLAALFALLFFVSACSMATRTVDVARLGPVDQIQVYEGGKPVLERPIVAGSAEDRAVTSWLRSHAGGWQPSVVTYAPGRRVRGKHFNLNFGKDQCVLNYRLNDEGDWVQVIRPIRNDDPIPDVFAPDPP